MGAVYRKEGETDWLHDKQTAYGRVERVDRCDGTEPIVIVKCHDGHHRKYWLHELTFI